MFRHGFPHGSPSRSGAALLLATFASAAPCGCGGSSAAGCAAADAGPGSVVGATDSGGKGDGYDGIVILPIPEASTATCDLTVDPTAAACLTASNGLFVSTAGSDTTGNGSPARPFATVGHALHASNGAGRIYICQGNYTERVALAPGASASLYGGFTCPDASTPADAGQASTDGAGPGWAPGGGPTVFAPTAYDPANNWVLSVAGVTTPVTIQGIHVTAPSPTGTDASGNGNSSIAAIVIGSAVNLVDVTLAAGRGVDGMPGAAGTSTPNYTALKAPDGGGPIGAHYGLGAQNLCTFVHDTRGLPQSHDSSRGGNGGDATIPQAATAGTADPLPTPPSPLGTPPQDGAGGAEAVNGDPGAYGTPRSAGSAAQTLGTLTASTATAIWTPTPGGAGGTGGPGQGGGGSGGNDYMGGDQLGAGGGAGGCGGTGGAGGGGGGASIALLSVDATALTLTDCTIITGGGGTGGVGGSGEDGQPPGVGGYGVSDIGGPGGYGAGGSGGAGGTGGVSAGIVYRGSTPPTLTGCSLTIGDPGHGGAGGAPGSSGQLWAGIQGNPGFDEYLSYGSSLASVKSVLQLF